MVVVYVDVGWLERGTLSLMVLNLFRGVAVGGMQALFSLYMASLGYSMADIGGVITGASLLAALSLPVVGVLIDTLGARIMVVNTTLLLSASLLLLVLDPGLTVFMASQTLFQLSFLYGQPARMAYLARIVPDRRLGAGIGVVSAIFNASRTLGPSLGAYMAAQLGYREAFTLLGSSALVGAAVFTLLSRGVVEGVTHRRPSLRDVVDSYRRLLRPRPGLGRIFLFIGVDRLAWGMWLPMLSAHLYRSGYSEEVVGLLLSLHGLVNTILLPLSGSLVDRVNPAYGLVLSEAAGALSALLLSDPTPLARAVAGVVVMGFSFASWIPSYNLVIARLSGGRLGEAYSQANVYRSIASGATPYIGGALYDYVSPTASYMVPAVMLTALALYALVLGRRLEPRS